MAGAGGALLALLTTYPLMTLNTRQHTEFNDRDARGDARGPPPPRSSIPDQLIEVMREGGGVAALYRGIEPAVIGTVTSQAVYNYWYAILRGRHIRRNGANPGALSSLAIASLAGAVNVLLTIPIWTVCVRMQAERKREEAFERERKRGRGRDSRASSRSESLAGRLFSFSFSSRDASDSDSETAFETHLVARKKTFAETTAAVWEDSGVAGFWQGVVPSRVMVSNPALQYAFYEAAADAFKRPKARKGRAVELTAAEVFVAASLAKLGATVLTYPVLLVKSRLQAMGKSTDPAMRYSGTLDAARRIFREEGPAAFYRGFGTKVTQTVFAAALMFAAKEEISRAVRAAHAKMRRARHLG